MDTINAIMKLNKIFKTNNWSAKDIDEFVFDNFCLLINNLNEKQRALILELTEKYKWISYNDYNSRILATMDSIEEEKLNNLKTIYLFPIIKKEDEGKSKSGQFLIYQIKSFKKHLRKYLNINFKLISKFEELEEKNLKLKDTDALFLIDDYIGSGETLNFCLEEIRKNTTILNSRIYIISLASQNEITEKIKNQGIAIYSDYISYRGITDSYVSPLLQEKIDIMLEIEKMIPGGNHFSFGYNGSEALITMVRTPDNTFPIFWKTYRKDGKKFEAPFSREENI
ncbi:hypothetical protein CMT19_15650 [Elizabethkingia anophelis]|nr:hypothetical protein [Elizabethkingia anophelis]